MDCPIIITLVTNNIIKISKLISEKNFFEAKTLVENLLKRTKDNPEYYYTLSYIEHHEKKYSKSLISIDKAIVLNKTNVKYLSLKAHILISLELFNKAIEVFDILLKLEPANTSLLYRKSQVYLKLDQKNKALDLFNSSISLNPNSLEILSAFAHLLKELNLFKEAVKILNKIIIIEEKKNPISLNDRGVLHLRMHDYKAAIDDFDLAIFANPNIFIIHFNLAKAYYRNKNFDKSLQSIFHVLDLSPNFSEAILLLAQIYNKKNMPILAIEKLREIKNKNAEAIVTLLDLELKICDWNFIEKNIAQFKENIEGSETACFVSLLVEDNPSLQLEIARKTSLMIEKESKEFIQLDQFTQKKINKKIRIAYISSDFRNHPTTHLTKGFFKNQNKNLFETYGFNIGKVDENDPYYVEMRKTFDFFYDVPADMSDLDLILKIRDLNIDIAVDLMGYSAGARTVVYVNRIASIQINYLGYPGTMGGSWMDYIIANSFLIPDEMKNFYSEKVVYLSSCYQINDNTKVIGSNFKTRAELGLNETDFVYCSFNQTSKINPTIFKVWMNILNKTKSSVLWLYCTEQIVADNLLSEAAKYHINPERIIFAKRISLENHLCRYQFADLFLDSFPYTSHTTASDCLWAGTPLLSICGHSFASRVSSSLLNSLNLNELITYSFEEYEDKAIQLCLDQNRLKKLKNKLHINKQTSDLFNTKIKTKQIEDIYLKLINIYNKRIKQSNLKA